MTDHERGPQVDERALEAVAKAICRVQLNGGDPDQPAIRWNGTQMEPQDFPAWHDYRDEAFAALSAVEARPAQEPVARKELADWSVLPKDLYVIGAQSVDGIGYDVQMCSVPMMTAPEVRYVRADNAAPVELDGLTKELEEARAAYNQLLTSWAESRERHLKAESTLSRTQAQLEEAVRVKKLE